MECNALNLHFRATNDFGFVVFVVSSKCDNAKRIREIQKARKIFQALATQGELQSSCRHYTVVLLAYCWLPVLI